METESIQLNLRIIESEDGSPPAVLIEGDQATLEWFGKLVLNHAAGNQGCGIQMFPNDPGDLQFASTATIGFYLHRMPCDHPTTESERQSGRG